MRDPADLPPLARTSGQSSSEMDKRSLHQDTPKNAELAQNTVGPGEWMTNNQGMKVGDDQNSLKAGPRGPTLLQDFHFREKMTHFNNERIPERVVHARGYAAHGVFEAYDDLSDLTQASLFSEAGKQTPVFVRFSTVMGSRGSADTARDVRGFAVKFYTDAGVWDLVGNNIPVFFIQDALNFPDLVHAAKPEQHNEIPQAQSAHDTFWDFAGLMPETAHMLMWTMSDRALPRSYAMMEGFGVHTFRFVNAEGRARFVKFHWKPVKGIHSLVWEEAQLLMGKDPDFHRRDLYESIERGDFPEWEFGVQIVEEEDEFSFGFDILDSTKIIPEEQVPVRPIGKLTLTRNPDNYFAEVEQVAYNVGHVVPGIDFTNDPLLQGRLQSYNNTHLLRVGPNFAELPINRPLNPVRNNQREGLGRQTINKGRVAYFPNGLTGGCPMHSPEAADAYRTHQEIVEGHKIRARSDSFSDHFSQATMFWNSMADWEKLHIAQAFAFELNQVEDEGVRARAMNNIIRHIHPDLARTVALQTGIEIGVDVNGPLPTPEIPTPSGPPNEDIAKSASPVLSLDRPAASIAGRRIGVVVADGVDFAPLNAVHEALVAEEAVVEIIAARAGTFVDSDGKAHKVNRAAPNAPSVIYDAVVVAGPASEAPLAGQMLTVVFIAEAFRHGKPILALGPDGVAVLEAASIAGLGDDGAPDQGILAGVGADLAPLFISAIKQHRFRNRQVPFPIS